MNNANDTLVELYKAQLDRFNQRRIYEWRVALTFWTGIVVATGFLAGKYQASTGDGVYFILLWIFYGYWIWNIWAANNYDKRWAEFYRNKIHESLSLPQNGQTAIPGRSDRLGFLKDWSFWSQMIFTAILLLTSWYAGLSLKFSGLSEIRSDSPYFQADFETSRLARRIMSCIGSRSYA